MWPQQVRPEASRAYPEQEARLCPPQRGFQAGLNLFSFFTICSQVRSRPGKYQIRYPVWEL